MDCFLCEHPIKVRDGAKRCFYEATNESRAYPSIRQEKVPLVNHMTYLHQERRQREQVLGAGLSQPSAEHVKTAGSILALASSACEKSLRTLGCDLAIVTGETTSGGERAAQALRQRGTPSVGGRPG